MVDLLTAGCMEQGRLIEKLCMYVSFVLKDGVNLVGQGLNRKSLNYKVRLIERKKKDIIMFCFFFSATVRHVSVSGK